jgi:hypothetical protein
MKKIATIVFLTLMILFLLHPCVSANDAGVIVDQEITMISLANTGLQVDIAIQVTNKGTENVSSLRFWIQQDVQDAVKITEKGSGKELVPLITGNIRICNLSAANLSMLPGRSMTFLVTYYLPTNTQYDSITRVKETTIENQKNCR